MLPTKFQRRKLKCEKLTDEGRQVMAKAHIAFGWCIYGRPSIKIAHFIPIRLQTWPPQAILVSDWQIF
jgi:hypothetical protein